MALYVGIGFLAKAGFTPKADFLIGDALFVGLTLLLLFLPFFNKIKVASWLELEREVKKAKEDIVSANKPRQRWFCESTPVPT